MRPGERPQFTWDDRKAETNRRKHRVTFTEAVTVFGEPHAVDYTDPDHSDGEDRLLIWGYSNRGRLLIVSYTMRGGAVRLISARAATAQERKRHADEL